MTVETDKEVRDTLRSVRALVDQLTSLAKAAQEAIEEERRRR